MRFCLCSCVLPRPHRFPHPSRNSVTRNNLGVYKPQVIGLPILLFVTGVVSELGTTRVLLLLTGGGVVCCWVWRVGR